MFQFSYGTTDNSLASNKKLFPRFFRLNPLTITYNRLRAAFVSSFPDWKLDVGLLYYADTYYKEVGLIFVELSHAQRLKLSTPNALCQGQKVHSVYVHSCSKVENFGIHYQQIRKRSARQLDFNRKFGIFLMNEYIDNIIYSFSFYYLNF